MRRYLLPLLASIVFAACGTSAPEGLQPVRGFQPERYLGRWYEVARLDHRFERGLSRVTAEYSLQSDGSIRVVNRGFDAAKGSWREAVGRARFAGAKDVGSLKVSFFGPFYGGYHVLALDPDYRWAVVSGPSRSYLWILSREPRLDPATYESLVEQARGWGFPVQQLIRVEQP